MCDDKKTKKFNIPVDAGMISFMDESFYGNSSITKMDFYDFFNGRDRKMIIKNKIFAFDTGGDGFFRGFYSPTYDTYCVMTL